MSSLVTMQAFHNGRSHICSTLGRDWAKLYSVPIIIPKLAKDSVSYNRCLEKAPYAVKAFRDLKDQRGGVVARE